MEKLANDYDYDYDYEYDEEKRELEELEVLGKEY